MGKLPNGPFGPFTGKVGKLVGVDNNGDFYIRMVPTRNKPFTERELICQHRFRITEHVLKPLLPFIKVGFKNTNKQKPNNAAKSYMMKNSLEGEGFDTWVNPALVRISQGSLSNSENIHVSVDTDLNIRFEWGKGAVEKGGQRDQVMMLAYDSKFNRAYFITAGNFRFMGTDVLPLPEKLSGKTLHVYAAFSGCDRLDQSNSIYLGELKMEH